MKMLIKIMAKTNKYTKAILFNHQNYHQISKYIINIIIIKKLKIIKFNEIYFILKIKRLNS